MLWGQASRGGSRPHLTVVGAREYFGVMKTSRDAVCHCCLGFCAQADSASRLSCLVLTGLAAAIISACNKSPEVKPSAEIKATESVAAEITPPGWINPQVTFLRKPGIDLAGPAAVPDGEPDLVLEIILEPALLKEVATWEIYGNANLGSWTSAPNKPGWWLIKTDLEREQYPKANRSRIRLCFPDNQDPGITKLNVRALQASGAVLFQQMINK